MAADPNPTLRAELLAALAVLDPQVRGLHIIADDPTISGDLLNQVRDQITLRENRQQLIHAVLAGLDAVVVELNSLEADGYPALPAAPLITPLFAELQQENTDFEAAVAVFSAERDITAGSISFSPNTKPPTKPGP